MIAFSAIWFLLIAGMALFPTLALRNTQTITWWDYAYPFSGVAVWFLMAVSRIGTTVSLSNFIIEVFWISVPSVAAPWLRWLLSRNKKTRFKLLFLILTFLPIATAVVIRLTMPTLPE